MGNSALSMIPGPSVFMSAKTQTHCPRWVGSEPTAGSQRPHSAEAYRARQAWGWGGGRRAGGSSEGPKRPLLSTAAMACGWWERRSTWLFDPNASGHATPADPSLLPETGSACRLPKVGGGNGGLEGERRAEGQARARAPVRQLAWGWEPASRMENRWLRERDRGSLS